MSLDTRSRVLKNKEMPIQHAYIVVATAVALCLPFAIFPALGTDYAMYIAAEDWFMLCHAQPDPSIPQSRVYSGVCMVIIAGMMLIFLPAVLLSIFLHVRKVRKENEGIRGSSMDSSKSGGRESFFRRGSRYLQSAQGASAGRHDITHSLGPWDYQFCRGSYGECNPHPFPML